MDHKQINNAFGMRFRTDKPKKPSSNSDNTRAKKKLILDLLRKGWSYSKIVEYFSELWEVKPEYVKQYYREVIRDLSAAYDETIEKVKQIQMERLETLLADCIDKNQTKTTLAALDQINKLNGLYVNKQEIKADLNEWKFNYEEAQQ